VRSVSISYMAVCVGLTLLTSGCLTVMLLLGATSTSHALETVALVSDRWFDQ
jgi:hypothetical protein